MLTATGITGPEMPFVYGPSQMRGSSSSTVFHRLRRYPRSLSRDAREDRLTEALAVTLNAAPDAAVFLVRTLFPTFPLPSKQPEVNTQVQVGNGNRIDLELAFGGERPELLVWFESKVDSPAYRSQGEDYMRRLAERGVPWLFAWLTKPDAAIAGGVPNEARHVSWQGLAEALHQWLDERGAAGRETRASWFVQQFLEHLDKEEMLAQTEPFSIADAEALLRYRRAEAALIHIVGSTARRVWDTWGRFSPSDAARLEGAWGGQDESRLKEQGRELNWFKYPCVQGMRESAWPAAWWFEFALIHDDWRGEATAKQLVVCTGLVLRTKDRGLGRDEFGEYVERLDSGGFKHGQVGRSADPWDVFFTHQTLAELAENIDGQPVSSQIDTLTQWVVDAFQKLNEIGPPTG